MTIRAVSRAAAISLFAALAATASRDASMSAQGQKAVQHERERGVDDQGVDRRMSGAGRMAKLAAAGRFDKAIARARARALGKNKLADRAVDEPREADDPEGEGPTGGQAENSIAVDSTGQHIVVGMNDTRGFSLNPISVSGFAYSDDGGATFVDGGQLPVTTGTSLIGSALYPEVFGDPDVKYLGGSTFVYFSIILKNISGSTAQTMGVHRSTDYGHTWLGPFEITPATRPRGASDAADKEFADVDPETGRVMMTWSNFTSPLIAPGGVEISSIFSDNLATFVPPATPTWSARNILGATATDGQMSVPRFAGNGSANVYVAWARFPSGAQNIGFARSTDNGVTFPTASNLPGTSDFTTMDQVLGNDRVNNAPSLAVDNSPGAFRGNIYVAYSNNNNLDGADVVVQRSSNQGVSFTAPVRVNSRPGADRAQWFPWVTVDKTTGRVYIFFYDQGVAIDGDLTETSFVFSDDGGATWSKPTPLTNRPFHGGYGNDTGQPNLGDYNQAVAQGGELFAVWAGNPPQVGFADGQPSSSFTVPDMSFKRATATSTRISAALGSVSFVDAGSGPLAGNGSIDPGETITFTVPLTNYVTNPLVASSITGINATLSSPTAGVLVTQSGSGYLNLAAGASAANSTGFVVAIGSTFVVGTTIDFTLNVTSAQGSATLVFSQATGSPLATTLLSQNFDAISTFPSAGWSSVHVGGTATVAWTTSTTSLGGGSPATISRAAFHANDAVGTNPTRWERLLSPAFTVPSGAQYVTVDFDTAYDTEDDPGFAVTGYDGVVLRLVDLTAGRTSRFVAVEAFEEQFTTGASNFYPKHLPRNGTAGYLEDLSAWSGDSAGYRHVHLKLPGMAGSTAQLQFEYTQDNVGTCTAVRAGHRCGVLIDNLVVQSVVPKTPTNVTLTPSANPAMPGQAVTFTATVTAADGSFATDGTVTFTEGATTLAGPITLTGGQATFITSSLSPGNHTITASYVSSSGVLAPGSTSVVEQILAGMSISNATVTEGASGIQSAHFTVSLAQTSPVTVTVQYATADGSATLADFDYAAASGLLTFLPGQTSKPVDVSVFGDSRFEPDETFTVNLTAATNALLVDAQGVGTILNDDPPGPIVDETSVNLAIAGGATRLRSLQNADGGWYLGASDSSCGHGPGVSCPNTVGVTALALLAAYVRNGTAANLTGAVSAGNALVQQYNTLLASGTLGKPHSQDIEFLADLAQFTGNTTYSTVAHDWFQVFVNLFPVAADGVDKLIANRNTGLRSLAAWDTASFIRAAKAVGNTSYALGLATRIRDRQADWQDLNPAHRFDQCPGTSGCGPADNPYAFDFTLVGEGSLLWAFHDLPGFDQQISDYRAFLLAQQDPLGSWDAGDLQFTAYDVLGLAAVGGVQTDAAIRSAMAFYLSHPLAQGGWPSSAGAAGSAPETTETDAEIVRAMFTLFNTPAGAGISVTPAQLSSLTFDTVTASGMTSVFAVDASRLPAIPAGYHLVSGLSYQITTTASITGPITACFSVPWLEDAATFDRVRVLQSEGGVLVDRTVLPPASPAPDFASRRVCARTSSLSPFAIALRDLDTTPPTITVTLSPSVLWPPNGRMVGVTATIAVHDETDPAPRVELVSITNNQPSLQGRNRAPDVQNAAFGTDDRHFDLRAVHGAKGSDLVYTVIYRAIDSSGNAAEATAFVTVPRKPKPAEDGDEGREKGRGKREKKEKD